MAQNLGKRGRAEVGNGGQQAGEASAGVVAPAPLFTRSAVTGFALPGLMLLAWRAVRRL